MMMMMENAFAGIVVTVWEAVKVAPSGRDDALTILVDGVGELTMVVIMIE